MVEVLREGILVEVEQSLRNSATAEVPFRRLLLEPPQYGAGESGEVGETDWPRYIRITDLSTDGALRGDDVRRLPPDVASPYILRDGDLLFARSGATVGKAFMYQKSMGPCCFAGYLIRFRVDRTRIAPEIVEAWTRSGHYWGQIRASSLQATIENVSAERYKDLLIPLPSRKDQEEILVLLTMRRERVRRLQQSLHDQVTLLHEHRQALITAAVTGQMKVPSTG
jgi:type I restriction enzyme, S subunit